VNKKMKKALLTILITSTLVMTSFTALGLNTNTVNVQNNVNDIDENTLMGEAKQLVYNEMDQMEDQSEKDEIYEAFEKLEEIGITDDMTVKQAGKVLKEKGPVVLSDKKRILNLDCDVTIIAATDIIFNWIPRYNITFAFFYRWKAVTCNRFDMCEALYVKIESKNLKQERDVTDCKESAYEIGSLIMFSGTAMLKGPICMGFYKLDTEGHAFMSISTAPAVKEPSKQKNNEMLMPIPKLLSRFPLLTELLQHPIFTNLLS
jgi:hypothetical protein